MFEELGSGQPTRAYGRFVEQGNDEETVKFYAKTHWPAVRGSERFADKAYLQSNAASKEVHRSREVNQFAKNTVGGSTTYELR